jgi:hypothetical protein
MGMCGHVSLERPVSKNKGKSSFFFVDHTGHGGGGWLFMLCHNHPTAKISMIAECNAYNQLRFDERGVPMSRYDSEVLAFFEDRLADGELSIGVIKSITPAQVRFATQRVGAARVRRIQMLRSPVYTLDLKWYGGIGRKILVGYPHFKRRIGRDPVTDSERFRGHCWRYYDRFYLPYVQRAKERPIVRLEDINRSMGGSGHFFKILMEWLTFQDWPTGYITHIQRNWTPDVRPSNVIPRANGRWGRPITKPHGRPPYPGRDNWDDDPEPRQRWDAWEPWQKEIFLEVMQKGGVLAKLGYDPEAPGTCGADWAFRGAYPWGDPGDE